MTLLDVLTARLTLSPRPITRFSWDPVKLKGHQSVCIWRRVYTGIKRTNMSLRETLPAVDRRTHLWTSWLRRRWRPLANSHHPTCKAETTHVSSKWADRKRIETTHCKTSAKTFQTVLKLDSPKNHSAQNHHPELIHKRANSKYVLQNKLTGNDNSSVLRAIAFSILLMAHTWPTRSSRPKMIAPNRTPKTRSIRYPPKKHTITFGQL